ncbi:unnamed protein product [Adineta steineri]|uniref:F-box domain-containing protein n=1 Tax=Adineta steineri TaxID=433720 RepID=A0A819KCZ7_9BILA|nr:unnamed protein product [Adineta steineri]CAF3946997.1 unnamed protein product [Adineta steineri]
MNLLDLPDEILLCILHKMNVVDALFRQSGLHHRLDQLLFDPIYVRELDFTIKSWDDSISPLTVEPHAFERILNNISYPKVSSLLLTNFPSKTLLQHVTGNNILIQLIVKQITHLNINIIDEIIDETNNNNDQLNVFELVLSISNCLIEFTFHQSIKNNHQCLFIDHLSSTNPICSTLTKLDIQVNTFDDCLSLLDGRFPSLSHFLVYVNYIPSTSSDIDKITQLSKLKYFSLTNYVGTYFYNDLVVPLIQRMSYLEELSLFLTVSRRDTYEVVDGNNLYHDILIQLSQLKIFQFSIYTYLFNTNVSINDFPSNDDIQRSFNSNRFRQIGSYVQHTPGKTVYGCHVYSLPFKFKTFIRLSTSFSGGIFYHVRMLVANDYVPWEYYFIKKVAESFPSLEVLLISNSHPQKNKSQFNNNNVNTENLQMITFIRLLDLRVTLTHIDYIEQLLFNRYTHLPRLCQLEIDYEQLITLTNNFTNDQTQLNCLQYVK